MAQLIRLLYVEDNEIDRMAFARHLRGERPGYDASLAASVAEARRMLRRERFDAVLLDYELGDGVGLDLFDEVGGAAVIILTGSGDERVAVEAMKRGALDYVTKDPNGDYFTTLPIIIENALQRKRDEQELAQYRQQLEQMVQERTLELRLAYDKLVAEMGERRRVEDALRQSEEKYRTLFTSIAGPILIVDRETQRFLDFNQTAIDLYGYTADELRAMTVPELHAPGNADSIDWEDTGDQTWLVGQYVHQTKSGRRLDVQIHAAPLQYGERPALISIVRDVSEHVRRQRLIEALNRAYTAMSAAITHDEVFESVARELGSLGITSFLLPLNATRTHFTIRHLSYDSRILAAAERLVGLDHRTYLLPIKSISALEQAVVTGQAVHVPDATSSVLGALPAPIRGVIKQLSRLLRMNSFISAPLIVNDEVLGLFSVQAEGLVPEDMPAIQAFAHQVAASWHKASLMQQLEANLQRLEETQDQLVQSQKMEAVGRLAGGIAHDFNNLLTPIIGYTEFALESLRPDDPLTADLSEVRDAAKRAATLTEQLLAFGRRQLVRPETLDLNDVIAHIERMLRRLIGEDIRMVTALRAASGLVEADVSQLEQVIVNLAINARDAMPDGGTLTIETRDVQVDEAFAREHSGIEVGPHVQLRVSDTGSGIADEIAAHIFEPFFTTKERDKGTGLGLATVYGIVEQCHGHIAFETELGVGTTFTVTLPRATRPVREVAAAQTPAASPRGTETLLVVEDDDMVRDLACRLLRCQGYTVLEANHPGEALLIQEQHEHEIDLLLTDVVMPGMSGVQLAERLSLARPGIRVLYMSGHADDVIPRQAAMAPEFAMLSKPFGPDELAIAVRRALDAS